jgi:hypothetical protein
VATQFWKYFINWWICFDIELVLTVSYPIFYQRRKLYCVRIYHAHPVGRNFNDDCFVVKAEGFLMFWFFWWKWEIFLFILKNINLREYNRCPFYNYSFDCFMDQNNDVRQFFGPLRSYIVVNFIYISWYLLPENKCLRNYYFSNNWFFFQNHHISLIWAKMCNSKEITKPKFVIS